MLCGDIRFEFQVLQRGPFILRDYLYARFGQLGGYPVNDFVQCEGLEGFSRSRKTVEAPVLNLKAGLDVSVSMVLTAFIVLLYPSSTVLV